MKTALILALSTLGLALSGAAPAQDSAKDPLAGNAGIRNYYRLRPDIATAGQPSDEAWADIKKAGFKAVINFRTPEEGSLEEKPKVEAQGMEYFNIPIGSDGFTTEQVELFSKILGDSDARPVLVHCASSNRVGAMWLLHQVLDEGEDETAALAEAKKAGLTSEALEKRAMEFLETQKAAK